MVGRITGVESAGSEEADDGKPFSIEYMNVIIEVTEVIHTAPDISHEAGDTVKVGTFLPESMTIDEANQAIPAENLSVHFLFSSASLRQRRGQPIGSVAGRWIYQTGDSVVVRDGLGGAHGSDAVPQGVDPTSFDGFLGQVRTSAHEVAGVPRPVAPIGLSRTSANEEQPDTGGAAAAGYDPPGSTADTE